MSKKSIKQYRNVLELHKAAGFKSWVDSGQQLAADILLLGAGLTVFVGGFTGWAASEITAKGKNDVDNVRSEYMNARLSADIAESESKLRSEYSNKQKKNKTQQKQLNLFR